MVFRRILGSLLLAGCLSGGMCRKTGAMCPFSPGMMASLGRTRAVDLLLADLAENLHDDVMGEAFNRSIAELSSGQREDVLHCAFQVIHDGGTGHGGGVGTWDDLISRLSGVSEVLLRARVDGLRVIDLLLWGNDEIRLLAAHVVGAIALVQEHERSNFVSQIKALVRGMSIVNRLSALNKIFTVHDADTRNDCIKNIQRLAPDSAHERELLISAMASAYRAQRRDIVDRMIAVASGWTGIIWECVQSEIVPAQILGLVSPADRFDVFYESLRMADLIEIEIEQRSAVTTLIISHMNAVISALVRIADRAEMHDIVDQLVHLREVGVVDGDEAAGVIRALGGIAGRNDRGDVVAHTVRLFEDGLIDSGRVLWTIGTLSRIPHGDRDNVIDHAKNLGFILDLDDDLCGSMSSDGIMAIAEVPVEQRAEVCELSKKLLSGIRDNRLIVMSVVYDIPAEEREGRVQRALDESKTLPEDGRFYRLVQMLKTRLNQPLPPFAGGDSGEPPAKKRRVSGDEPT